jgi:ELWxxDGT repeat protein
MPPRPSGWFRPQPTEIFSLMPPMSTPRRVADIRPGAASSAPGSLTAVGNSLFFAATDGSSGYELWKTDGTTTSRVADINPGASDSSPFPLTAVGNTLFFSASDGSSGYELWKTDGTTTSRVADIRPGASDSNPRNLTAVGNTLFFSANDGSSSYELWKTDGTTTSRVADIRPGAASSFLSYLTAVGNTLFFKATDGTSGDELWKTDGTATSRVADIRPGASGSVPTNLTAVGNTLFFSASDGSSGYELWKTNGTTTSRVADINPGAASSYTSGLTAVGNTLFFSASDGSSGYELWKTDGTTTSRVADIRPGSFGSNPSNVTAVGNTLFFTANDGSSGEELWKTNGTTTSRVADINPGAASSYISGLTAVGNTLFFTANDGSSGQELWKTDGTTTNRVTDINPGSADSSPGKFTAVGNTLFFTARDGTSGRELWALDLSPTSVDLPAIALALTPAAVTEDGASNLVYTFTRTGPTTSGLRVNYTVDGTATLRTDYTGIAAADTTKTVRFAAGSSTTTVTVTPRVDTTVEANETVALKLAAGTGYTVGTTTAVTGTITNDDFPRVTLAVSPAAVTEDGASNLVYTFTRTGPTTSGLRVNYTVDGTATLRTDYTGIAAADTTKTVRFAAGSSTTTVTVTPRVDTTVEANETVALTLAAGTGYTVGTTTAVTGTITDDDFPSVTLAVSPASVTEDGASNLVYTFTRTGPTTSGLRVNYTVDGTATLRTDYTGIAAADTTKTVRFAAGSSTTTVTVTPRVDTTVEANETVALTLAAGTGYTVGTTTAVTGTITNDDIQSAVSATLVGDQSSLLLTGTKRINGAGNSLNKAIFGHTSNNRIIGGLGKDTLTGRGTTDSDTFAYNALNESLLSGYDVITDFNSPDRLLTPFTVETATLASSVGNIRALNATAISGLLSTSTFAANTASAFTSTGQLGTFIALNDGRAGFQSDSDSIVFLKGFAIGPANVVELI